MLEILIFKINVLAAKMSREWHILSEMTLLRYTPLEITQ